MTCPYCEGWKNQEGWLKTDNGKLVCWDWDAYCTECRVDDSQDYTIELALATFSTSSKLLQEKTRMDEWERQERKERIFFKKFNKLEPKDVSDYDT